MAAVRWSAAMVEDFIALLQQGEGLRACAVQLTARHGVPVSRAVAGRKLVKLRAGPRKAEVPGPWSVGAGTWTAVQRGELLQLIDEQGLSVEEVAALIDRPEAAVFAELSLIQQGKGHIRMPRKSARMRHCLRCSAPFVSEGAHNRMCDPCRRVPPSAVDVVAHAGVET